MTVRRARRIAVAVAALAATIWVGWGLAIRARRAPRPPPPPGEARGAWHVHTTASDGRGTLDEVVAAAAAAGLQFVVVSDHNVVAPAAPEYRRGVLVVPATEASTRVGHVVAVGLSRPLSPADRDGDPLGAIRRAGGRAVLAHPFHPRRPFTGWDAGPWTGIEVVSNDGWWHEALARRAFATIARAALVLPFDPPRAVLAFGREPVDELARLDAAAASRDPGERRVLLCSADAHGYPSYRAAFEAFSMHVPVALSGDAAADARAVEAALLDGRAACVFVAVARRACGSPRRRPAASSCTSTRPRCATRAGTCGATGRSSARSTRRRRTWS
jgi:hypothetical protein